jgi:lincosamide nucleotidyltransferase A/C/D/E
MGHDAQVMRADQVADLYVRLADQGVDCCVVGGWGVDALVGTVTREHKDLDVLMPLTALRDGLSFWAEEGFELAYTWSESRGVAGHHPLLGEPIPSAFVLTHQDGREIDVHVYEVRGARVISLWDTDRVLEAEDLADIGSIGGVPVRCMTASMQLTCHQGYDLPAAHAADVSLLQQLIPPRVT